MPALRCAVIVNPARVQALSRLRRTIDEAVSVVGWPPAVWLETTPDDPGTGQALAAVAGGAQVVIVCGGDGTVRAAIAGLAGTDAALAIVPSGTGNLLAQNLGIPLDLDGAVTLAVAGGRRRIDIGEVDGQVFAVMAGMGFDAAMMGSASTALKARFGSPAYVLSALGHLRDRRMLVVVRIDDQPPKLWHASTVLVGNVGRLQGGIRLMPDARPDNESMEVAILTPRNLGDWTALTWAVLTRRKRVPRMDISRGTRIDVLRDRVEPRQLDGDVIEPSRSLTVLVRPSALLVCVP